MADPAPAKPVPEQPPKSRAGRNLPAAIATGVGLFAYIIATLIWWNWGFAIFVAVALTAGVWELNRALRRIDLNAAFWPIVVLTPVTVLLSYWLGTEQPGLGHADAAVIGGAIIAIIASLVWRMRGPVSGFVKDAAASLFIIAYLLVLGSTLVLMLADTRGAQRVMTYLVCVVAADTGAYAFGVLFGKHKMAPRISPAKTWEGLSGGIFLAMVVGAVLARLSLGAEWWVGALVGLSMAVVAAMGDLIESMIKRDVGVKDMSQLLPGHGGAMDRLDSLIVAGPVAWLIMYALVPR